MCYFFYSSTTYEFDVDKTRVLGTKQNQVIPEVIRTQQIHNMLF